MKKSQIIVFQLVDQETGMRSGTFEATLDEYINSIEPEIPEDKKEKHYVIIWASKEDEESDMIFSNAPMMLVKSFTKFVKEVTSTDEEQENGVSA